MVGTKDGLMKRIYMALFPANRGQSSCLAKALYGLYKDEMSVENAILLRRCINYKYSIMDKCRLLFASKLRAHHNFKDL